MKFKSDFSRKEERRLKISKALLDVCVDLSRKDMQLSVLTYDKESFLNKDNL
jgi:hypothetical protein